MQIKKRLFMEWKTLQASQKKKKKKCVALPNSAILNT